MVQFVRVVVCAAAVGWLAGVLSAGDAPRYRLEIRPVKQIEVAESYTFCVVGAETKEWVLAIQKPPASPRQHVTMAMGPASRDGFTEGPERHPVSFIRKVFARPQKDVDLPFTLSYRGTMNAVDLVPLEAGAPAPRVAELPEAQRAYYTAVSKSCDWDSPVVKSWIGKEGFRRRGGESDIDFARRVYLALPRTLTYNMKNETDQRKASAVVRSGVGVCQGLSLAYAAVLRANGIPARSHGLFLGIANLRFENREGKIVGQDLRGFQHADNEFWAEGVGWVPVDVTPCLNVHARSEKEAEIERLKSFGHWRAGMLILWDNEELDVDSETFGRADSAQPADFRSKFAHKIERRIHPANASGYGLLWTGTDGSPTQRHEQIEVTTTPLAPERLDPAGRTDSGGEAGYQVWRDESGWHVHGYCGGKKAHKFAIAVSAEPGTIEQCRRVGHAGAQSAAPSVSAEYTASAEGGLDFRPSADAKTLRLNLRIDGQDAVGPNFFTYVGKGTDTPMQMPFLLALTPAGAPPAETPAAKGGLDLQISAAADAPTLIVCRAANASSSAVAVKPFGTTGNCLAVTGSDGRKIALHTAADAMTEVPAGKTVTWRMDLARYDRMIAAGTCKVVWHVGDQISNTLTVEKPAPASKP